MAALPFFDAELYHCVRCFEPFPDRISLSKHSRLAGHWCACGKVTNVAHLKKHLLNDKLPCSCEVCNRKFPSCDAMTTVSCLIRFLQKYLPDTNVSIPSILWLTMNDWSDTRSSSNHARTTQYHSTGPASLIHTRGKIELPKPVKSAPRCFRRPRVLRQ